jgi:hypothetical protein
MSDRWGRLAPLVGLVFVVLIVVGIVGSGESPEGNASSAKVISYYSNNSSKVKTFDIIFIFAFLALVLFAAVLRSYLRSTPASEGAAALVLAGALLMAVSALIGSAVELGLAENISHLEPAAVQSLNLISDEIFLPALGGAFLFGLGSGIAILRGARLPNWLGWVAIVIGVLAVIPPTSFPALFALVIWTAIVSVLMYLRSGGPVGAASTPATEPA